MKKLFKSVMMLVVVMGLFTMLASVVNAETLKSKEVVGTIKEFKLIDGQHCFIASTLHYGNVVLDQTDIDVEVGTKIIIKGFEINKQFLGISWKLAGQKIKSITSNQTHIILTLEDKSKIELCRIPSLWTKSVLNANKKLLKYFVGVELWKMNFEDLEFIGHTIGKVNYIDLVDMSTDTILNRTTYKD